MPRPENDPNFPSEWHWEAHLEALEKDVAGLQHRVLELEGMGKVHPDDLQAAKDAVEVAKKRLRSEAARGQRSASKRPKAAADKEVR